MAVISDAVISIDPRQSTSRAPPNPGSAGMSARPAAMVAAPIGRLTKKIQCQLSTSVIAPPASRPSDPPATATKTYALIARARSAGCGNSVTMIARITDAWTAAPTPCRKRAPISAPWLGASPHRIDAAVKNTTPARNTRLRPNRSPSRPASRRKPPNVTRKAFTTQVRSACVKCRSAWIEGSATFTIVVSSTIISCARQTTTSASQRRRSSVKEGEGMYGSPGRKELNWRNPPEVSGGCLRLGNYSGGTLRFVKRNFHEHHRSPPTDPPPPPEARGRPPQLRQGRDRGAGGVRRARRLDIAGGGRPARRGRDRHAVPQLPEPPGAARGGLCRRGREPVRVGDRVR